MFNPSYLIKSRHDIYYFRYPLPCIAQYKPNRVSISLRTRCPKQALRLAKTLEYYSINLIQSLDFSRMSYKEIVTVFKKHFAKLLNVHKQNMDELGPLPKSEVMQHELTIKMMDEMIKHEIDSISDLSKADKKAVEADIHKSIMNMSELYGLNIEPDSEDYAMAKSQYKFVLRNMSKDILAYNNKLTDYSMDEEVSEKSSVQLTNYSVADVMEKYLSELQGTLSGRSYNEQRDCLKYLIDALGTDYYIGDIDVATVQKVKSLLMDTPTGRNKGKLTRDLSLEEQVDLARKDDLPTLSTTSVNKYLAYFSSLCGWAQQNNMVKDNQFKGISVKSSKKKHRRRDHFNKPEVRKILTGLSDGQKSDLVKTSSYYWGALLATYTGARRNEIASLLPDDIIQDAETKIWYIAINDEEESKRTKSDAATRIVPIHSQLIERGFLEYVEKAKRVIAERPTTGGQSTRLLYDLTYTDHGAWGRKLGRWFNETYLVALELKTAKKTLHSLRHSFITNLSAARVEFPHIRAIVGHEAGTVTEINYTHFEIEHLPVFKEAIEKISY